jgi:hypothetical protein
MKKILSVITLFILSATITAQKINFKDGYPNRVNPIGIVKNIPDSTLLEIVQRQTFRYFWHYAHPVSGLARERDVAVKAQYYWDYINEAWDEPNLSKGIFGSEDCAIGGTGMGILSTVVAVNRGWIGRDTAVKRLIQIADFLIKADCYHGIYPHFMNGTTGKVVPFDRLDDGADIVETSYLLMGFLCAREYFTGDNAQEKYLRKRIDQMWGAANWNWHTNNQNKLFWHWSPRNGFDMNFPVWGYNECLITYILSASSQYHSISADVYNGTWTGSQGFKNGKEYYGYRLPLGNYDKDKGGPLFFEQYTFMGINPNGLTDSLGNDYFEQGKNHTLINRAYCIENPNRFKGYSDQCWGLTAGDSYKGYVAHSPENDRGVIQPTAAISSMPYTPKESMEALKYFYYELGNKIWGPFGFADGFSIHHNWYAKSHLAIDQGPIVVMIENYRTGLIWNLFMKIPDVQNGLKKLGFKSTVMN